MTVRNFHSLPEPDYSTPIPQPGLNMWMRCVGVDPTGVIRVKGEGPTWDIAQTRCSEAIEEFLHLYPGSQFKGNWDVKRAWIGRRTAVG